ncbi:MAG: hypothetical protein GY943_25450 [Chloroflexi bacterium]|nr:hypothetical protein [Chloroflexota bacterium]
MESVQIDQSTKDKPFTIKLTLPAKNLLNDWKQCSMLANYIAEYVGYQYAQQERAENLISTITNELLETIVALAPEQSDLTISLQQFNDGLQVNTDHGIRADVASPYINFLDSLNKNRNEKQYFNMLTTEETPELDFNQLGLLMLTHDFGASLFNCPQEKPNRICTQLYIADKEFQA